MRSAALVSAALFLGACSREALPPGTVRYEAPTREFSTAGPERWRVEESRGGAHRVTLYGPSGEHIAVYRHESGALYRDAREYLAAQSLSGRAGPAKALQVGGRSALEMSVSRRTPVHAGQSRELQLRIVTIEAGAGFYALVHASPAGSGSTAAFETVLRSFKPL